MLRERFETTLIQPGEGIGIDGLLWSRSEATFTRSWANGTRTAQLSAFEHWFMAFADARNEILHHGSLAEHEYVRPGSPYVGRYVEVGDRVLREAIKVTIGLCGWPRVWRQRGLDRASLAAQLRTSGDTWGRNHSARRVFGRRS
jgi:hypothetical protein